MAGPASKIVLVAGGITFAGEWYWQHEIDWKVPLATLLLAAGMEGFSDIDKNGATILSLLIAIGAFSTKFKGHSAFDIVTGVMNTGTSKLTSKNVTTVK